MASNSTFSVIGADVSISGNLSATTELHVDGHIHGDVDCDSLVQGEGSVIEGGVHADSARLAGTIKGALQVRELVVLQTARIEGDVHYDSITIEQGAQIDGRFTHRVPGREEPEPSRLTHEMEETERTPALAVAN